MNVMIGLTGGIACGKSTAAEILVEMGFEIVDTDHIAHDCILPGGPCYDAVVHHFGRRFLDPSGTIDRQKLGDHVFNHPEELKALNRLLHPEISRRWRAWRDEKRAEGKSACVIIPLLFEVGATDGWDAILVIRAKEDVMIRRLVERGLTPESARQRISAQMSLEEKATRADVVIDNNGSVEEFKKDIHTIVEQLNIGRKVL